ncbi:putative quinol monooxygenase [Streptomyces sp. 8N706]|uniref:putative quinol monooxygenase n=1 Tax=Streptomyces sp. 8N706 TaxID=3457416 RepID=UPI003FD18349
MFSRFVTVKIKPGVREDFLAAITRNADASVRDEPGCVRFDVCADREDPLRFHLYEVYTGAEAAEAHRSTPHFLAWRAAADQYVAPGTQVNHSTDLVHSAH